MKRTENICFPLQKHAAPYEEEDKVTHCQRKSRHFPLRSPSLACHFWLSKNSPSCPFFSPSFFFSHFFEEEKDVKNRFKKR